MIHTSYIIIDGHTDKQAKADVAVVLGNKVNEDGILSPRLQARLDKSIELYKNQRIKWIIVSGGLGKEGFWEADIMKQYLMQHQIPETVILVDNYGNDTEKTVANALKIMDSLDLHSAISVTQYFHQTRTKKLFRNKGIAHISSASPKYYEWRDVYSLAREFVAYYKEAL